MSIAIRVLLFGLTLSLLSLQPNTAYAALKCKAFKDKTSVEGRTVTPQVVDDALPATPPQIDWSRPVRRLLTGPVGFIQDIIRDVKAIRTYEQGHQQLLEAQGETIKRFVDQNSSFPAVRAYVEAQKAAVLASRSVLEVRGIGERYRSEVNGVLAKEQIREERFQAEWSRYQERIASILQQIQAVRMRDPYKQYILNRIEQFSQSEQTTRQAAILLVGQDWFIPHLERNIEQYQQLEAGRNTRERRVDVSAPEAGEQLWSHFKALVYQKNPSLWVLKADRETYIALLDQFPELRSFLYREMQTARRYLAFRAPPSEEGLRERLRNDIDVVEAVRESGNLSQLEKIEGLRAAVRALSQPNLYQGVPSLEITMLRAPTSLSREKLIREALKDPVVAAQVALAVLEIQPPALPKPPAFTMSLPKPPKAPAAPSNKKAREWKAYQDEYDAFKSLHDTYFEQLSYYNKAKAGHAEKVVAYEKERRAYRASGMVYQVSLTRQMLARRAVQAFFAMHSPASFSRPTAELRQTVHREIQNAEAKLTQEQKRKLEEQRSANAIYSSNSSSSDVSVFDFFMYIRTHDPLWITMPDLARSLYLHDLLTHSGPGSRSLVESEVGTTPIEDILKDSERFSTPEELGGVPGFDSLDQLPEVPEAPLAPAIPDLEPMSAPVKLPPPVEAPAQVQESIDNGTYNAPAANESYGGGGGGYEAPTTYSDPSPTTYDSSPPSSFE